MRVLVVQADAAVADATAMLLAVEGHEVALASTVEEALAWTEATGTPDAVVCDLRLPSGRTAFDAIATLRDRASWAVPAVIVADEPQPATIDGAGAIHACRVLLKPMHAGRLVELMRELASRSRPGSV